MEKGIRMITSGREKGLRTYGREKEVKGEGKATELTKCIRNGGCSRGGEKESEGY